jgi:hypothetical protein
LAKQFVVPVVVKIGVKRLIHPLHQTSHSRLLKVGLQPKVQAAGTSPGRSERAFGDRTAVAAGF